MSEYISPIGHSWEELRGEFLTPEEREECEQAVTALGELLDARDAREITEEEFEAAVDLLDQSVVTRVSV